MHSDKIEKVSRNLNSGNKKSKPLADRNHEILVVLYRDPYNNGLL